MTAVAAARGALFPRWVLLTVGTLLAVILLAVSSLRASGWSPAVAPGGVLAQRSLAFADTADSGVSITDADTGRTVAVLQGEQGFVRGVLRGLARDRRQHSVSAANPYTLTLHDDGRLLIADPQTGQRIDLASFGPDNAAVFLRWLPPTSLPGARKP